MILSFVMKYHFLGEIKALSFLKQIIEGYNFYRNSGSSLRDINIHNILVHNGEKIAVDDFGFSKLLDY